MAALAPAGRRSKADQDREFSFDPASASVVLLDRADRLRDSASGLHPLVANAYRRRAAELTVAAWVGALRSGIDAGENVIAADFGAGGGPGPIDAA